MSGKIESILIKGEQILITAKQLRFVPGGSLFTPNTIYVTNMRIIFNDPECLGLKSHIIDMNYKDISNIRLDEGIFSTVIYIKSRFMSEEIMIDGIDKRMARQIIKKIQEEIRYKEDTNKPL